MGNYTPNPLMTQPIYDPTRPFATPKIRECLDLFIYWRKTTFGLWIYFIMGFLVPQINGFTKAYLFTCNLTMEYLKDQTFPILFMCHLR